MGNPGHAPLQGGLRVFLRFALPVFVLAAILSHALSYQGLMAAMRVALFLIVARIIHLTAGIRPLPGSSTRHTDWQRN